MLAGGRSNLRDGQTTVDLNHECTCVNTKGYKPWAIIMWTSMHFSQ